MKALVFGSFNIDKVYFLPELPEKGESVYCEKFETHVGGKGLNQALTLKKAGADVRIAGKVGPDGSYLTDYLAENGLDISLIDKSGTISGHTIIEVDTNGQNQMILFGGANREINKEYCDRILENASDCDFILTQYETSCVEYLLRKAHEKGLKTVFNPSPFVDELKTFPLEYVDCLILNEYEGKSLSERTEPQEIVRILQAHNHGIVVLTLGEKGAVFYDGKELVTAPAFKADAVDTTGAGDTFTGYFLNAFFCGESPFDSLIKGAAASAIEVSFPGAAETIPDKETVKSYLKEKHY